MSSYIYCHKCSEIRWFTKVGDDLKCSVCVHLDKQSHLNLVHVPNVMSTTQLKTVKTEEEN